MAFIDERLINLAGARRHHHGPAGRNRRTIMGRSGYTDDVEDQWALIRWRGAVKSSLRGARGQTFLKELLAALDAMEEKTLTKGELESDGEFCTLGVIGRARGVQLQDVWTEDWYQLSKVFGISEAMAREIMYENDEAVDDWKHISFEIHGPMRPRYPDWGRHERHATIDDPTAGARRWQHMRDWVAKQITKQAESAA